jgi:acyl-CoA thioesterase-2
MTATASFHADAAGPELPAALPEVPAPDALPPLQDWVPGAPADRAEQSRTWVDRPPPLDIRIGEAPCFLGGAHAATPRSHWMRLPSPVEGDPSLHAALLAYASDYFLLDMAFRADPAARPVAALMGLSLDHAIWIHRPVRFERWHLHTQELLALTGERGLVRGSVHDADGHLVASVAQEVLVRELR